MKRQKKLPDAGVHFYLASDVNAYRAKVARLAKLSRAAACWVHNKKEHERLIKAIAEVENGDR